MTEDWAMFISVVVTVAFIILDAWVIGERR